MSHAKEANDAWVLFETAGGGVNWLRHLHKVNDRVPACTQQFATDAEALNFSRANVLAR